MVVRFRPSSPANSRVAGNLAPLESLPQWIESFSCWNTWRYSGTSDCALMSGAGNIYFLPYHIGLATAKANSPSVSSPHGIPAHTLHHPHSDERGYLDRLAPGQTLNHALG